MSHDPIPAFWDAPRAHALRAAGLRHSSEPEPPFGGRMARLRLMLLWLTVVSGAGGLAYLVDLVWPHL